MARKCALSGQWPRHATFARRQVCRCAAFGVFLALLGQSPARAADQVRISRLSDVAFGTVVNLNADSILSQSLCLYSKSPPGNYYSITATGSGAGGAFVLASGADSLPYEVQWSDSPGQSVGAQMQANQPLTGQQTTAGGKSSDICAASPLTASLIVVLRSTALAAATSGTYSGTLTLFVAPQ